MSLTGNWSYPTAIKFGAGRIAELPEACAAAGMKAPLLVTDKGLANLPITQQALDILDAAGLGRAMFAEIDPNPTEINMDGDAEFCGEVAKAIHDQFGVKKKFVTAQNPQANRGGL